MTSQDVRSILNLSQSRDAPHVAARKPINAPKKPEGLSRELYALIGDNAPSLAEAQASLAAVKYRNRPKANTVVSKWQQATFTPASREPSLRLKHWIKADVQDDPVVSYFGQFNHSGPSVMEYSQYEYDQFLSDPSWTPHETAYLFDLLRAYDLRFVVIADRYEYSGSKDDGSPAKRSIEDIKERYYSICRRLVRSRTATDLRSQQQQLETYSFDKSREIRRKQYASELFHLTAREIAEEEALYVEVKRMEQVQKRYRSDRDQLLRSIIGVESGLVNVDHETADGGLPFDRKRKRRPEGAEGGEDSVNQDGKKSKATAHDGVRCIYRVSNPESNPGSTPSATKHATHNPVFLRSTKLPVPKANATIRITEILTELGVSTQKLVMPTRTNIEMLEAVFNAAAGVIEMKRQVDRVEQELRTLRAQKEGFVPPPENVRRAVSRLIGKGTSD
ncbi:hypothetical protein M231_01655 [Tremella mesenterica]|uniref:SWR1-complex protein 4 n=1 Tax=Tremella mesenterica TaxID=5217 RepID=A0A4Q1BSL5_TREME|nr:hypothetical protein M231_01655 [Tremella mesenterica]